MMPNNEDEEDEEAEDVMSYDSEDEFSEDNGLEEYMVHMEEQMAELKEMILQLTTGANTRSSRIERRLNLALRKGNLNKRRIQHK